MSPTTISLTHNWIDSPLRMTLNRWESSTVRFNPWNCFFLFHSFNAVTMTMTPATNRIARPSTHFRLGVECSRPANTVPFVRFVRGWAESPVKPVILTRQQHPWLKTRPSNHPSRPRPRHHPQDQDKAKTLQYQERIAPSLMLLKSIYFKILLHVQ